MFKCEKCGNTSSLYIGIRGGKEYCRRCISFQGEKVNPRVKEVFHDISPELKYPLSEEQNKISEEMLEAFKEGKNIFLHAVCGAGKTEITYRLIAYCLSNGLNVGFCIPRRDVVIELEGRIREAFPSSEINLVYGGHTSSLEGDIILLTSHQLYRYEHYFDLLIMDETDAFPFANNEVLNDFFFRSLRGNYLLMSATPYQYMIDQVTRSGGVVLRLMKRYHNHPLIVPEIQLVTFMDKIKVLFILSSFLRQNKPVLVFSPSISDAEELFNFLHIFLKKGRCVHSRKKEREEHILMFKKGELEYLVSTSVLERGITIRNLQVIVYKADSSLFSDKMLIQISGRVGRKIDAYDGKVIYVAQSCSPAMNDSIAEIKKENEYGFM